MQTAVNEAKRLISELSSIKKDLNAVDRTLKLHIIQVETEYIAPIRSVTCDRLKLPHGELTRLLIVRLKQANGIPTPTAELTKFVASRLHELGAENWQEKRLKESVRYRLKNLAADGVVKQLPIKSKADVRYWYLTCTVTTISK